MNGLHCLFGIDVLDIPDSLIVASLTVILLVVVFVESLSLSIAHTCAVAPSDTTKAGTDTVRTPRAAQERMDI